MSEQFLNHYDIDVLRVILKKYENIQWFDNENWVFVAEIDGEDIELHVATKEYHDDHVVDEYDTEINQVFSVNNLDYVVYVRKGIKEDEVVAPNFKLDAYSDVALGIANHVIGGDIDHDDSLEIEGNLLDEYLFRNLRVRDVIPSDLQDQFLNLKRSSFNRTLDDAIELDTRYKYVVFVEKFETSQSSRYEIHFINNDDSEVLKEFYTRYDEMAEEYDEPENGVNYTEEYGFPEDEDDELEVTSLKDIYKLVDGPKPLLTYWTIHTSTSNMDVHPDYISREYAERAIRNHELTDYNLGEVSLYKLSDGSIITITKLVEKQGEILE